MNSENEHFVFYVIAFICLALGFYWDSIGLAGGRIMATAGAFVFLFAAGLHLIATKSTL